MALELTKEQEAALIIVANREIARKAIEDAVAQAEEALRAVQAQFDADRQAAYLAAQAKVDADVQAVLVAYVEPIRDAQNALDAAKRAVDDNTKAQAVSAEAVP